MSLRTATLLDRSAEILLRPIVVKSVAKKGENELAELTSHAVLGDTVDRANEGRARQYPRRADGQGAAHAGHCQVHARSRSYLRQ